MLNDSQPSHVGSGVDLNVDPDFDPVVYINELDGIR